MLRTQPFNRYTWAVWRRQALVWRQLIWSSMATNVANPLLFLFAFGYGLGAVIDRIAGLSYLEFVVPGMMAYSAMFASSFETTISAYARFDLQRTWDAILATPVALSELLLGETVWAATKGMLSAISVLVVGWIWGGVPSTGGALLSLPVVALACLCFAACGLAATAHARSWEFFSYFFTFWVTPMFIFCGTFFEIDRFPAFVQWLAWLLPMSHTIAIVRPLMTGLPLDEGMAVIHIAYLLALTIAAFLLSVHRIGRRMFD